MLSKSYFLPGFGYILNVVRPFSGSGLSPRNRPAGGRVPPGIGPYRCGVPPVLLRYCCGIRAVLLRSPPQEYRTTSAPYPPRCKPNLSLPHEKRCRFRHLYVMQPDSSAIFVLLPAGQDPDVFRIFRAGDLKPATTSAKTPDDGNAAGHADDDCIPLSSIPTTHFPFQPERFFFDFRINGADTTVLWHSVRHGLSETGVPACQTAEIRLIFPPPAQHTFPVL